MRLLSCTIDNHLLHVKKFIGFVCAVTMVAVTTNVCCLRAQVCGADPSRYFAVLERQILEDLMTHEKKSLESAGPSSSYLKEQVAPQYSSSSSGDEEMEVEPGGGAPSVSWMGGGARGGGGFDDVEEFEDESSEDGDDTVMVKTLGGKTPFKCRIGRCKLEMCL